MAELTLSRCQLNAKSRAHVFTHLGKNKDRMAAKKKLMEMAHEVPYSHQQHV